tara:strand:- start:302 stop:1138 length:837 start_codon:yes stop_codon:yes gene_type:complete
MTSLYPHQTFSTVLTNPDGTTGAIPISSPPLSEEEKDVIALAFSDASPFKNPMAGFINASVDGLNGAVGTLSSRNSDSGDPLFETLDGFIATITTLSENLNSSNSVNFLNHTNRLSGTSGGKSYLRNDGGLYGFGGLQGIASSYNNVKEAMRGATASVEDNYSIFFTSILNVGESIMSDTVEFGADGRGITGQIDGITISELEILQVPTIAARALDLSTAITDNIDADNTHLSVAVDFLKKFGNGMRILSMNKDTYFGRRLLDVMETDLLRDELDDLT